MDILLGFFMCLSLVLVYDKFKKPKQSESINLSEEEQRKEQEQADHYKKMMNFDYTQALGGDKHAS